MRSRFQASVIAIAMVTGLTFGTRSAMAGEQLTIHARSRVEEPKGSGEFRAVEKEIRWSPAETAVVVCDMWRTHWCKNAMRRAAEFAPRANEAVCALRKQGVLIIHCPSPPPGDRDYYKDLPQRKRAKEAPPVPIVNPPWEPPPHWKDLWGPGWRPDNMLRESPLPLDVSDDGCDCIPQCKNWAGKMDTRQTETIPFAAEDVIAGDNDEAYFVIRQRGIKNVIILGVHLNLCMMGRRYGIRNLVYQGQNILLVRDLTDCLYNPRMPPFVSHYRGTELMVEHIEKYWCPSITSDQIIGGHPFRFADDERSIAPEMLGGGFHPAIVRVQLDRDKVHAGESLQMRLDIRSNTTTKRNYRLFAEFFGIGRPRDWRAEWSFRKPTSQWQVGDLVHEGPFMLSVPAGMSPGWRRVLLGMFDPGANGARLQLDNADRHERNWGYYFGEIEVLPPGSPEQGRPGVWLRVSDPAKPERGAEEWRLAHARRVADVKKMAGKLNVLFIGDSITGGWLDTGRAVWEKEYVPLNGGNIGVSGSQTQSVLWQFDHGALDGIQPRVAVLMIGVNNVMGSPSHSARDIAHGIYAIVQRLRQKLPNTKILLLGTFPAGRTLDDPRRQKIREVNVMIAKLDNSEKVRFLDISKLLLNRDGTFSPDISPDAVHLSPKGYQIWADAMRPLLSEMKR